MIWEKVCSVLANIEGDSAKAEVCVWGGGKTPINQL